MDVFHSSMEMKLAQIFDSKTHVKKLNPTSGIYASFLYANNFFWGHLVIKGDLMTLPTCHLTI